MDGFFAAHNLFSLPQTWLLLAALFAAIEIFAIPAIGFIFAALGALVTALCLQFGWIDATPAMAFSAFFATTVASGLLLWRWLKNLYQGRGNYSDVIGTTAEVCERHGALVGHDHARHVGRRCPRNRGCRWVNGHRYRR